MNIVLLFALTNLQVSHLASHFVQGQYFEVKIVDTLAYFATGWGLEIYNISNPAEPQLLCQEPTNGDAWGIDVAGNFVFIADMYNGLVVFDATDITNPIMCGEFRTRGYVEDVAVNQNNAYLADDVLGLIIVNIFNPTHPVYLGSWASDAVLYSVHVVDTIAYLGSNNKPLQIVSVADPVNPHLIGECPLQDFGFIEAAYIVDTIAFLAGTWHVANTDYKFLIVNVADPANPTIISGLDFADIGTGVIVQDNYAYVNAEQAGVRIVDISNLVLPIEVGYFNEAVITGYSSAIKDSILIVPEHTQGYSIVNVNNPARPVKLAHKQSMLYQDFEVYNLYKLSLICNLYSKVGNNIQDHYTVIKFIDLQDMVHPTIFSELNFSGSTFIATTLTFDYPYGVYGISRKPENFVAFIDFSNPGNPQLGKFERVMNTYYSFSVKHHNSRTYVSSPDMLYIGDINLMPFLIDSISIPRPVYSIVFADSFAYCSCMGCMMIINVNQLSIISTTYHSHMDAGANNGIILDSTCLYVPYWDIIGDQGFDGFMVFDVSDAGAPVIIIDTMVPEPLAPTTGINSFRGCCLVDSLFFRTCGSQGFDIWNVQNPEYPIRLLTQETPATCINIRVINDKIIVMDNLSIEVYAMTETGFAENRNPGSDRRNSMLSISPNPIIRKAKIQYYPKGPGNSIKSLKIFNTAGQLTKNFVLPVTYSALPRTISWDGTDNTGMELPQGIYFFELIIDNQTYVEKAVLLK